MMILILKNCKGQNCKNKTNPQKWDQNKFLVKPEREKSGFLAEMSENQSKIRKTVPKAQNQENQENQSTSEPCIS